MGLHEKQRSGQPWRPHAASDWNAMLDAALAERQRVHDQASTTPSAIRLVGTCKVQNNEAVAVGPFAALAIRAPIIDHGDNPAEFQRVVNFECHVADASDLALEPQKIAIVMQPLTAGALGTACIAGVVPCQVNIQADGDRWAGLTVGETYLTSSAARGPVEILWPTSGATGLTWCYVRLPVSSSVPATVPGDTTFAGDVIHNGDVTINNNSNSFTISAPTVAISASVTAVHRASAARTWRQRTRP